MSPTCCCPATWRGHHLPIAMNPMMSATRMGVTSILSSLTGCLGCEFSFLLSILFNLFGEMQLSAHALQIKYFQLELSNEIIDTLAITIPRVAKCTCNT